MDTDNEIDIRRQITCVKDELKMRRHLYPQWVAKGRMTQRNADSRLAEIAAVLKTLESLRAAAKGLRDYGDQVDMDDLPF